MTRAKLNLTESKAVEENPLPESGKEKKMEETQDEKVKPEFTKNDAISLMHQDRAASVRMIADYVEKWELNWEETVKLLREIGDESEAQSMVVELRDKL